MDVVSPESFFMGTKMSDEIDTDMIEDSINVIENACMTLRKSVLKRAIIEKDLHARHKVEDVFVYFDAVRYSGHRRNKDLMLVELEQLCDKLDKTLNWSAIDRPFDSGIYQEVLDQVELALGAIYSALGIYRISHKLLPLACLRN